MCRHIGTQHVICYCFYFFGIGLFTWIIKIYTNFFFWRYILLGHHKDWLLEWYYWRTWSYMIIQGLSLSYLCMLLALLSDWLCWVMIIVWPICCLLSLRETLHTNFKLFYASLLSLKVQLFCWVPESFLVFVSTYLPVNILMSSISTNWPWKNCFW